MYILAMFPYPSGNLHLGHLRVYTIADVVARYHVLQGRNVLLPMGWDAFGLPAENAAIERGIDPAEWTKDNMAKMKEQLQQMNAIFDWTREIATCDPEFYKHTQKIFLLLLKHGLVSQKKATVNWDPVENTVLANEQVDADGRSWRSGAVVEQRELEQWFLHITEFKESLLRDLKILGENDAWPEKVLGMQRNWLGRSDGAYYRFPASPVSSKIQVENFEIFTTRPETIFAAQFLAISPNSQLADELAKEDPDLPKRDTDTMDTFMDSSWYYMRFPDPHNLSLPISEEAAKKYLPVDIYVGGVEHAILHLLYSRFVYKAVMGLLYPTQPGTKEDAELETFDRKALATQSDQEPFKRLITQEMVYGTTYTDPDSGRFLKPDEVDLSDPSSPKIAASGREPLVSFEKMSKSKHNGVDPGSFISKYGADATRAHILFQAPVGDVLNWDEHKIAGITRWLHRVYKLALSLTSSEKRADWDAMQHFSKAASAGEDSEIINSKDHAAQHAIDSDIWRTTQNTIISVTKSMEKIYPLNTAISDLTNLTNVLVKTSATASEPVKVAATAHLLRMLAPIAPAVAEECWSLLYPPPSRNMLFEPQQQQQPHGEKTWPVPDGSLSLLHSDTVRCAVKVNGRLRCVVEIPASPPADVLQKGDKDGGGGGSEFERWITDEILKDPKAREKLGDGAMFDIRKAKKVFPVSGGRMVSYVLE
ncbi:putative leucyl-trna synthetase protein [Eutypa lata UCREL1]|uniref:leucine--tRNA ligase n=1 Tax=Eutypa lata (strain UCR-EL1) TaxID=1287681 RepID=M7TRF4_EUTLA|nr:putative leucyl-trna synthetase protein [Eutypa lata UCREL1]